MSLLYDKVVTLINKPPEERSDNEITQILPWFTKKSDLFQSLHTDIVRDIVKNCKFEVIKKDTVIIRQMDKGDCFYIILSGKVSIHINTTLTEEEYESVKETQLAEEAAWAKDTTGRPLDRSKYGIYVGKIDAGKSFGELALINADCVRNATIIADETTDLLCVDRDLYNRSLRAFQAQEFEQRKEFVRHFRMFQNWAPRYKKMMTFSLKKQTLKFEDTIVKQGSPVDGIYFIIKGQVKIRVDPNQHPNQYPHLYPLGDIADLEKEKAREMLRQEMNLERQKTSDKRSIYHKRTIPQADVKKSPHKSLELCLAGSTDVIGDLEVAMGLNSYSQTVECTEESTIYHLDQRNYDRLIEKRNPQALEMLKDIVHTKLTLHFSRLHDEVIPLYRYFLYTMDEKEKDARRLASMPRTKPMHESVISIANLQKGPLVDMYGPGTVFYLIRKRAKEIKVRQQKRSNYTTNPFQLNSANKTTRAAPLPGVSRGILNSRAFNANIYKSDGDEDDQGSTTASMINLYGGQQGGDFISALEAGEYVNGNRMTALGGDSADANDLDSTDGNDWVSSNLALDELEGRLTQWHQNLPTIHRGTCVVPLHRYQVEDESKPRPGNKVYVKIRSPTRNVSFVTFHNTTDVTPSSEEMLKLSASRLQFSSIPLLESITDNHIDVRSETA
ncbi:unnamed protein product, partial [Candidula unifasciata]